MKIYLAGAMSGIDWNEANEWRDDFIEYYYNQELSTELEIFNPCNYVSCTEDENGMSESDNEDMLFDLYNLRNSDIMVVNWDNDSIGTSIEIGVAKENNIPILVYCTDIERLQKMHPWVKNSALRVFTNLYDMLRYLDMFWIV